MMEWSLSELYPSFDSPEFQGDLKELENRVKEFNDWSQGALKDYTDPVSKAEAGINIPWLLLSFMRNWALLRS